MPKPLDATAISTPSPLPAPVEPHLHLKSQDSLIGKVVKAPFNLIAALFSLIRAFVFLPIILISRPTYTSWSGGWLPQKTVEPKAPPGVTSIPPSPSTSQPVEKITDYLQDLLEPKGTWKSSLMNGTKVVMGLTSLLAIPLYFLYPTSQTPSDHAAPPSAGGLFENLFGAYHETVTTFSKSIISEAGATSANPMPSLIKFFDLRCYFSGKSELDLPLNFTEPLTQVADESATITETVVASTNPITSLIEYFDIRSYFNNLATSSIEPQIPATTTSNLLETAQTVNTGFIEQLTIPANELPTLLSEENMNVPTNIVSSVGSALKTAATLTSNVVGSVSDVFSNSLGTLTNNTAEPPLVESSPTTFDNTTLMYSAAALVTMIIIACVAKKIWKWADSKNKNNSNMLNTISRKPAEFELKQPEKKEGNTIPTKTDSNVKKNTNETKKNNPIFNRKELKKLLNDSQQLKEQDLEKNPSINATTEIEKGQPLSSKQTTPPINEIEPQHPSKIVIDPSTVESRINPVDSKLSETPSSLKETQASKGQGQKKNQQKGKSPSRGKGRGQNPTQPTKNQNVGSNHPLPPATKTRNPMAPASIKSTLPPHSPNPDNYSKPAQKRSSLTINPSEQSVIPPKKDTPPSSPKVSFAPASHTEKEETGKKVPNNLPKPSLSEFKGQDPKTKNFQPTNSFSSNPPEIPSNESTTELWKTHSSQLNLLIRNAGPTDTLKKGILKRTYAIQGTPDKPDQPSPKTNNAAIEDSRIDQSNETHSPNSSFIMSAQNSNNEPPPAPEAPDMQQWSTTKGNFSPSQTQNIKLKPATDRKPNKTEEKKKAPSPLTLALSKGREFVPSRTIFNAHSADSDSSEWDDDTSK